MGKNYRGAIAALALLLIGIWAPANAASILYGVNSAGTSDELLMIGTGTGSGTIVGGIGFSSVRSLAYDAISATLYGVENTNDQLIAINLTTGSGSVVGALGGGFNNVQGLTFDGSGTLYGSDTTTNSLVTINTTTGAASVVGASGALGSSGVGSLAYDVSSGTLFGASFITDQLITIDTSTGVGTDVGALGFGGVTGLAWDATLGMFGADTNSDALISINQTTGAGSTIGALGVTSINGLSFAAQAVPVPAAAWLFGSALGLLGWIRRRSAR